MVHLPYRTACLNPCRLLLSVFSCRHEIVGIVTDVGSEVTKFQPGQRAGVGVFVDTCRSCTQCGKGEQIFCPKLVYTYNSTHYDGLPAQGGYSTHIVIAAE